MADMMSRSHGAFVAGSAHSSPKDGPIRSEGLIIDAGHVAVRAAEEVIR